MMNHNLFLDYYLESLEVFEQFVLLENISVTWASRRI